MQLTSETTSFLCLVEAVLAGTSVASFAGLLTVILKSAPSIRDAFTPKCMLLVSVTALLSLRQILKYEYYHTGSVPADAASEVSTAFLLVGVLWYNWYQGYDVFGCFLSTKAIKILKYALVITSLLCVLPQLALVFPTSLISGNESYHRGSYYCLYAGGFLVALLNFYFATLYSRQMHQVIEIKSRRFNDSAATTEKSSVMIDPRFGTISRYSLFATLCGLVALVSFAGKLAEMGKEGSCCGGGGGGGEEEKEGDGGSRFVDFLVSAEVSLCVGVYASVLLKAKLILNRAAS
ncbi:hypothetical protein BDR26DRAFT_862585 [Obelidium mucronatum]|nr:hypothetical protein BDR26DRAFT_862585 [Obelidium mucronatum]